MQPAVGTDHQDIIHSFMDQGDLLSSGEKSKTDKSK